MLVQQAAAAQRDSHRLQVPRCHRIPEGRVAVAILESGAVLAIAVAAQRQEAGKRRSGNTGNLPYRFQCLREELLPGAVTVVSVPGCLHLHRQQA